MLGTDIGALKSVGLWIPAIYVARARVVRSAGQDEALREFSALLESMPKGTVPERLLPSDLESRLQFPVSQLRHHQHLRFLLGKRAYHNGDYPVALRHLANVAQGDFGPRALLYSAAIEVRARRSVPAIVALMRALEQLDAGNGAVADAPLLRGTALLSIARIYLASSLRWDPESNAPRLDSTKISAAYKYYQQAFPLGGDVPEVAYELAWLSHLAGNDALEAGMLSVLLGSGLSSPLTARLHILRAAHALNACHDTEAKQELERYQKQAGGLTAGIVELLQQTSRRNTEDAFALLILAPPQSAQVSLSLERIIQSARGDHAVAGLITWLHRIDEQRGLLARQPTLLQPGISSAAFEVLEYERVYAIRSLSRRVREHLEYARDRLMEADADAARLTGYVEKLVPAEGRVSRTETQIYGAVHLPNLLVEHPFIPTGYRHLESGYFFESYGSECGR